ncbi:MAG: hypothetical protein WA705_04665 [Candidatus Ozemobacteraceae bacterium]
MNSTIIQNFILRKRICPHTLCLIFLVFFFSGYLSLLFGAEILDLPHPLVVSDRLYFDGPEGNAGLAFQVKFFTVKALTDFFKLDTPVGNIENRSFTLRDILVNINFDGGNTIWADVRLSGPKPIILNYLSDLERKFREKNLLSDFSWNFMNFKPTAYYETEGMSKPMKEDILSLFLSTNKPKFLLEEPIIIQAVIKNNWDRKLTLVKPQDASINGFRYPLCVIELKNEQGLKEGFSVTPACKTVDALASDAFFEIEPGKPVELFPKGIPLDHCFKIQKPGIYYLMCRYSTIANHECKWYGAYTFDYWNARLENEFWKKNEPLVQANRLRLADVERADLQSEWVKIEIEAPRSPDPGISKTEAGSIAEKIFAQEKWPTNDINVRENGEFWDIQSNSNATGRNGYIRLNRATGEVISKHITGP